MPTFDTPEPVSFSIDLIAGEVRITASDRTDTVVEVRPRDESNENDVKAMAQARVDYADGTLTIRASRPLQSLFGRRAGTLDVTVDLPSGSRVRGHAGLGEFRCVGRLGECVIKVGAGDISVDEAGATRLTTSLGRIEVERTSGRTEVSASGEVRVREVDGEAVIKNLSGDTWVGEVSGDVLVKTAHGNISVDHAGAAVVAKTAFGNVCVGDVARKSVVVESATGELEVGIRSGTAAWLDLKASTGTVHNTLRPTDRPQGTSETVEVRARTYNGDIVIRRASEIRGADEIHRAGEA